MTRTGADARQADVIVVGAGPAGAATAYWLATAGVDVLLLEKAAFPRDKICGDGLTPRAVKQLVAMGFDLEQPGWQKNRGLRIKGAGHTIELPWPDLTDYPPFGMVRARMDFDEILALQTEVARALISARVRGSMKAPPPVASTPGRSARRRAITRRSPSRKADSPRVAKISGIDMPAAATISASESMKGTPRSAARRLPTLVLPAPISPTKTSVRLSLGRRRARSGAGCGVSIIPIAVWPRSG